MFTTSRQKKQKEMFSRYKEVFSSESGKFVLRDLLNTFQVLDTTFDDDPRRHAFNEGSRAVVVRILKTINTNPEAFEKMLKDKLEENYEI